MEIKIKINLEEIKRNKCNNKILLCYMIYIYIDYIYVIIFRRIVLKWIMFICQDFCIILNNF